MENTYERTQTMSVEVVISVVGIVVTIISALLGSHPKTGHTMILICPVNLDYSTVYLLLFLCYDVGFKSIGIQ